MLVNADPQAARSSADGFALHYAVSVENGCPAITPVAAPVPGRLVLRYPHPVPVYIYVKPADALRLYEVLEQQYRVAKIDIGAGVKNDADRIRIAVGLLVTYNQLLQQDAGVPAPRPG